ncbi:MAG TPA: chitobiase/beta-hexosaminidase C-terminal domain-containing protein, partial [Jatrophihabitans sp.]|nr:chitobiase/beta-hexosaminidase C-terminal domain-containing protein [Jatrophihabitans sp.]
MQAVVNGAATRGGGWAQIVMGRVCSSTLDAANYSSCSTASGHIELADLNTFLDWVANAGQPGGAPANTTLRTVRAAASSADTTAPTTTISCNGAPCSSSPYSGIVTVALAATDVGSSVAAMTFTTDGTDPTPTSTAYTGPFSVNGSNASTTVKFRSWDYAGNAEAVNTQVIQAPPDTTAPTTTISCNNTTCGTSAYISSVTVTFAATDTGGSGLSATYYTTDGSTPTLASSVYSAPIQLNTPGTYNVQFFSTDRAGNAEAVQSQQVKVAPVTSKVSLTFDNGSVSQYTLGYQQALQPHGAPATFFVNSGTISNSANTMTWAQLNTLATAGADIGGKTVNATNLTTDPNPTNQVCNDRAALVQHGLHPVAFAYPGGAFNASIEGIVKSCGYGSGRSAGSLSPTGPTYAETLPPKDWYATRAYAPTGQVTLANMKSLVTGAASHGGGWSQIVLGRVCSQAQDPNNYTACTASGGWIELADLNAFLDWMGSAGQSGGAPAGAALSTVRDAAIGADTSAPVTTAACNGNPCTSDTYTNTVYVTLSSTDVGSAVASTRYTLDGTDPTLASPTYTKPIPITSTTTVRFRSFDNAGNAEAINTLPITASLPADTTAPTTAAACDGNPCTTAGYNGKTVVTLNAADPGGWGVDQTYYTLDGTAPSTTSTVYSGPFTLDTPGTYILQFFSTDLAGNSEQTETQTIVVLAPKVTVSLTFDDGLLTQYQLADKRALKPHHLNGTFYNISGLNNVDDQHMTWANLVDLNNDGNEVGGHTVDHVVLKGATDIAQATWEVCQDRQNLIDHGLYPTSFAYPTGAYDAQAESIVKSCGYTSGRAAGGLDVAGDGAGPVYSETMPPKDLYALRTGYDQPAGNPPNVPPLTLSHLQSMVTAAAQHGGGWVPIVFHDVCSQQLDPANYSFCINDWGPVELDTLNQFLDWLNSTGQPGGAPPRTQVLTVSQVINGPDTQAPISVINCDGAPCQSTTYSGSTTVTFASKDPGGSGVAATYYTTDGSTPTTSSPTFSRGFTINQTTTFNYFSVDNSGNVEPAQSMVVTVAPNPDPVIGAAGDIACDPDFPAFNNGIGTDTDCRASHTANLLNGVDAVLGLGDMQYQCSGPAAYAQAYDPTWGVKKSITHPVPGGEDYLTSGGTDCQSTPGAGYYQYFGAAAGDPTKGYYSYNLGQWHIVAINTAPCENGDTTWCAAGSQQDQWLKQDLAANQSSCTLAYYQDPRFASSASGSGGDTTYQDIWQDLYTGGVDVVLNGDSHWYERFNQLNGAGQVDTAHGVREFIVGTGGAGLDTPGAEVATSQALNDTTHGVIRMTLHGTSYSWSFMPDEGTFTDAGSANCHGKPDPTPPTTAIACNGAPCSTGWYQNAVQVSLAATDNPGGSGVGKTYYTTDGTTPTTSSPVYTGPFTVAGSSAVRYFSVDAAGNPEAVKTQQIQIDATPPATVAACNTLSCSGTYTSNVQFSLSAADNVGGSGVSNIFYTTDGTTPTRSSPTYTTPLNLTSTTTVKFFALDAAGNAEAVNTQVVTIDNAAPTTTIQCNNAACSGWSPGAVQVSLTANDNGGVGQTKTYYTTDGSTPSTSSTLYSGPFPIGTTATVKFFSVDGIGNTEAVQSQLIQVDPSAPVTTATCNGGSCSGWFNANVQVSLAANDTGGSGVSKIYFTTNGTTPTTASPAYAAPFSVTATTTVKFFAVDVAGNAEAVNTQVVQIDKTAPTTTIRCNNAACSGTYPNSVSVTLPATDTGGSGLASTHYTTDGTTP